MKKVVAILLSSLMMLSMAACGKKEEETKKTKKSKKETTEQTEETEEPEESSEESSEETTSSSVSIDDVQLSYELDPEDRAAAIIKMMNDFGGFEVCYTGCNNQTSYLGAKDNHFWYLDIQDEEHYTLNYAIDENGQITEYLFLKEGDQITYQESWDNTIEKIGSRIFFGQDRIVYDFVMPQDYTENEFIFDRFVYDEGAVAFDILHDVGITGGYMDQDNMAEQFKLGYFHTGTDVEILEMPEAGLAEGDIDSIEYWVNKFGMNVCPFTIVCDGVEKDYYFRSSGSLVEWLRTEMNDGWYFYNDCVISADGKWAIEAPALEEYLSSFCSYEAVPYNGPTLSEEERAVKVPGTLYAVHSWTPLNLWGCYYHICVETKANVSEEKTFAIEGLLSQFQAGDEVQVSIECRETEEKELLEGHVKMYVMPHVDMSAYNGVISEEAEAVAIASAEYTVRNETDELDYSTPIFSLTLPTTYNDAPLSGDVDVIFTYEGVIAYYYIATIA